MTMTVSINSLEKNYSSSLKKNEESIQITSVDSHLSSESNQLVKNPFLNPKVEAYYRQVYSECNYESYSAFDPHFTWEEEEEKKLVRKLNYRVAFAACLMFVSLQIDREFTTGSYGQFIR